jgi:hypothetical protein
MITREQVTEAGARLLRTIAAGDFGPAEECLYQYRRSVDEFLAGTAAVPEKLQAVDEAEELFRWARRMTLAARAHAAPQYAQAQAKPQAYRRGRRAGANALEVTG